MIRVVIADDHPVVLSGLVEILSLAPDMHCVGRALSATEVLEIARQQPCDVVVLDLSMPGRGGLEVLKDLKREHPKLPVLILSVHPEDQFAERVLRSGAAGYLTKDSAVEDLVKAIRQVVNGGKYVSAALGERLADHLTADLARAPHEGLSDREYLVMTMIASGKTLRQIADELALSPKTIATYRSRIFKVLRVRRASELIRYAMDRGLVA